MQCHKTTQLPQFEPSYSPPAAAAELAAFPPRGSAQLVRLCCNDDTFFVGESLGFRLLVLGYIEHELDFVVLSPGTVEVRMPHLSALTKHPHFSSPSTCADDAKQCVVEMWWRSEHLVPVRWSYVYEPCKRAEYALDKVKTALQELLGAQEADVIQESSIMETKCMALVHWLHRNRSSVCELLEEVKESAEVQSLAQTDPIKILVHTFCTYTPDLGEKSTRQLKCEVSDSLIQEKGGQQLSPHKHSLGVRRRSDHIVPTIKSSSKPTASSDVDVHISETAEKHPSCCGIMKVSKNKKQSACVVS